MPLLTFLTRNQRDKKHSIKNNLNKKLLKIIACHIKMTNLLMQELKNPYKHKKEAHFFFPKPIKLT